MLSGRYLVHVGGEAMVHGWMVGDREAGWEHLSALPCRGQVVIPISRVLIQIEQGGDGGRICVTVDAWR